MGNDVTIVVLDDDPTGTQTVHGISVLTRWETPLLREQFKAGVPLFYILTNSRSLPEPAARALATDIGQAIRQAAADTGRQVLLISRSDSTLRGHFPAEVDALAEAAGLDDPLIVLAPAFIEGGRITEDDIHYIEENGHRTPVSETPFARDPAFAYQHANLRDWVLEKSKGSIAPDAIISLSLDAIRTKPTAELASDILSQPQASILVINALTYEDLEAVSKVLWTVRKSGRTILLRSAASIVRTLAGLSPKPLLTKGDLLNGQSRTGGLIIAGSFVPKTTQQLAYLNEHSPLPVLEVNVADALTDSPACSARIVREVDAYLEQGQTVLVQSERQLVTGDRPEESLAIGQRVSGTLVDIVKGLRVLPSFIIAKGGITSSDLATKGMGVRVARVIGQIIPGVPVWEAEPGNRFHGIPYVVFPGNVGDEKALVDVLHKLQ
ncbi:four-carbon acid sugar kinase family protein [Nibrella saemangeumensis]|uniref:Four-carbon acid sugar kinase family protein n=2 Tax=Nibrella saemangeumensis TaxID=1084526 RepID=A0ABP8NMA4_9BACT